MSTQKQKFALFQRLQNLGFTYEEAAQLRRIEMTLQRWAEMECGDSDDYCSTAIERDEETGKPFRAVSYHNENKTRRYPIADREAGALRRLKAIVAARNARYEAAGVIGEAVMGKAIMEPLVKGGEIIPYHQTDCRGCMLYLVRRSDLGGPFDTSEQFRLALESNYNRGVAVCA